MIRSEDKKDKVKLKKPRKRANNLFSIESEVKSIRSKWNAHFFNLEKTELKTVEILGLCKTAVDKIRNNKDEIKGLNQRVMEYGYKPNSASSIHHKMLMLVMNETYGDNQRKSISRWAKVLNIADANDIKGENLVQWVLDNGGINEIAYPDDQKKKREKLKLDAIERATAYFENATSTAVLPNTQNKHKEAGFVVMFGEVQADFSTKIFLFSSAKSLINPILEKEGNTEKIKNSIKATASKANKAKATVTMEKAIAKASQPKVPLVSSPNKKQVNEGGK